MRVGVLLCALLPACSGDTVEVSIRLSLDPSTCGTTDPSGGATPGADTISLACGAEVGLFLLDANLAVIAEQCATVHTTLADVPSRLSSFRSGDLSEGDTISVALAIVVLATDPGTGGGTDAQCDPPNADGTTGLGNAAIEGQTQTVVGSTETIDVVLRCNDATPCENNT